MNRAVIDLLTRTFQSGALPHPGDENRPSFIVPIPGMRTTGMGDEQAAEMIGQAAKLWAEAITSVLEGEFEMLTKADAAQLRQDAADAPDGTRIVTLYDRADHQRKNPLLMLTVGKTDDVVIDRKVLQRIGA